MTIFKMYLDALCRKCGTADRKHKAIGLCTICYRHKRYEEVEKIARMSKKKELSPDELIVP